MIKALIDIGKNCRDFYPMPLIEIPYLSGGKNDPKVLVVNLMSNVENSTLIVTDIILQDYSLEENNTKYFFRNPSSSQGPAPSLSFKLPAKPSALRQRLGILNELDYRVNVDNVAREIEDKLENLRTNGEIAKNTPILIVLKIDGRWPAENHRLQKDFVEKFFKSIGNYKNNPDWTKHGICHGCDKKDTIYGGVGSLMKFYTVDKHGYAPYLDPKKSWKQYALCKECVLDLERGRRAVDDFLTWRFYGEEFWLLPVSTDNLKKTLYEFQQLHKELSGRTNTEGFEELEDELIYNASLQKEVICYHFMFVQKENQALRIKLHIEEILPSLLAQYVSLKKDLEMNFNDFIFDAIGPKTFVFNFFSSSMFRATNQRPGFTKEDFYMLVDKVFRRSYVSERYLITKIMLIISKEMAEAKEDRNKFPRFQIIEALLSLLFLHKWGILKRKRGGINMSDPQYQSFFDEHKDFFNHPAKRGLVLLGVLVQNFLNKQYERRESTPFLRALKNLKLNQKDVQNVFVSLQNKMNEYEIGHWWPELRKGIGLNFIEAGDKWPLSPEEIGFYIAIGMALYRHPAFKGAKDDSNNSIN